MSVQLVRCTVEITVVIKLITSSRAHPLIPSFTIDSIDDVLAINPQNTTSGDKKTMAQVAVHETNLHEGTYACIACKVQSDRASSTKSRSAYCRLAYVAASPTGLAKITERWRDGPAAPLGLINKSHVVDVLMGS